MPALTLRHADPERDAAACAAIYAPYVDRSAISFEEVALDERQLAARIETTSRTHPWLVLDDGQRAVAFAYASQHRIRSAYRWTADVGIYIAAGHQGAGAGRRLYEALLDLLRRQNFRTACAGITLPNDASVGLHRAFGFELVGIYRQIGWKNGAWQDVGWWQLALTPGNEGPPAELLVPQQLQA